MIDREGVVRFASISENACVLPDFDAHQGVSRLAKLRRMEGRENLRC